jgi:Helix-turn-helix domain
MEETRPDPDQLLTTPQAAELLGLHPFTLHGWRCDGRKDLPWYVIGRGRIRYRRGDVLDYIQRGLYGQGRVPARFRQAPMGEER